jgi:hypothetical protein
LADLKISQLTDGGASQATDEYVVARSGSNFRIDGASVAAAATSLGTLSSLTVSGAITSTLTSGIVFTNTSGGTNATQFRLNNTGGDMRIGIESSAGNTIQAGTSAYAAVFGNQANYPTQFTTNGTVRATIDASGNLGLGVTPSSGAFSGFNGIQIKNAHVWGYQNSAYLAANTYVTAAGGLNYIATAAATYYEQGSGAHKWYNAPSGTAGNAITFTQAMTLDASGNLQLGTTTNKTTAFTGNGTGMTIGAALAPTIACWDTSDAGYVASMTQIGADMFLTNTANGIMVFNTNNTERARITSGGYFKASNDGAYNDSAGAYHEFLTNAGNWALYTNNKATSSMLGVNVVFSGGAPNGTGNPFLQCTDGTTRAAIRSNGGLANFQANNVDLSDIRTKREIASAASMWDKIAALEIVEYKYIDQTHDDVNLGVIAQQVETVEPVWVDADGFGDTPEGEEPFKTVYNKDIYFAAIKALQEAMARIEALEARLEALEA